jgi:hypothetical protein
MISPWEMRGKVLIGGVPAVPRPLEPMGRLASYVVERIKTAPQDARDS